MGSLPITYTYLPITVMQFISHTSGLVFCCICFLCWNILSRNDRLNTKTDQHIFRHKEERTWLKKVTRQAMYVQDYIEALSPNRCCCGNAIIMTCSEFVFVALLMQRVKHMYRIVLSSVDRLALPEFSTLPHKRHDYWGKTLLNIKCGFSVSLQHLFQIFLILIRIQQDSIINVHRSSSKVIVILVMF